MCMCDKVRESELSTSLSHLSSHVLLVITRQDELKPSASGTWWRRSLNDTPLHLQEFHMVEGAATHPVATNYSLS